MKKAFTILLVALLVVGFAISCKPEPTKNQPTGLQSKVNISEEITNMDPKDAKAITAEQKAVVEKIFEEVLEALESLESLMPNTAKGLDDDDEEVELSGTVTLSITSPLNVKIGGVDKVVTELVVGSDLSNDEDMTFSCKIDGTPCNTPSEELLDALEEAILTDITSIQGTLELEDISSIDESVSVAANGTISLDEGTITVEEPITVSIDEDETSIALSLNGSLALGVDADEEGNMTVSVTVQNLALEAALKAEDADMSAKISITKGEISVIIPFSEDEDEDLEVSYALTVEGEASLEASYDGLKMAVSLEGLVFEVGGDTSGDMTAAVSVQSATLELSGKLENEDISAKATIKNGTLTVLLSGDETAETAGSITVEEITLEASLNGIKLSFSLKGLDFDPSGAINLESAEVSGSIPQELEAFASINGVSIDAKKEEYAVNHAIAGISTKSGYIAAKISMNSAVPAGVVSINGNAVTLDSFMEAFEEMMAE